MNVHTPLCEVDAGFARDALIEAIYRYHGIWTRREALLGDRIYLIPGEGLAIDDGGGAWFEREILVPEPTQAQLAAHRAVNAFRQELHPVILNAKKQVVKLSA